MFCFDAATGAAIHARLRRGRSGASTGIDSFLTETLRRVPTGIGIKARLDSGFYGEKLFVQMDKANVSFICGVPLNTAILAAIGRIPRGMLGSVP